jgi:hypothetical protein
VFRSEPVEDEEAIGRGGSLPVTEKEKEKQVSIPSKLTSHAGFRGGLTEL